MLCRLSLAREAREAGEDYFRPSHKLTSHSLSSTSAYRRLQRLQRLQRLRITSTLIAWRQNLILRLIYTSSGELGARYPPR